MLEHLAALRYSELVDLDCVARAIGFPDRSASNLRPRGYRALTQTASLSDEATECIIAAFPTYDALMRATLRELQAIDGISPSDAAEVQQGLRRLHDRHLRSGR